jgi:DNA polymerase
VIYEGVDQNTKKWQNIETYGGKLVENIVQAIARDCLADAMLRLEAAGIDIAMHVHDETANEEIRENLSKISKIMGAPIAWAPDLPMKAETFETAFYKKD